MIHWIQHCGSWFGFTEPARYVPGNDGGNFVSVATGAPLHSIAQNGMRNPERGLTPWAAQQLSSLNLN